MLINADCNVVNLKDFCGMTPLHCAARLCNVGLVELLLEKAADANAITYKTKNHEATAHLHSSVMPATESCAGKTFGKQQHYSSLA